MPATLLSMLFWVFQMLITTFLTDKALLRAMVVIGEYLVPKTSNTIDDAFVAQARKALDAKT